MSNEDNFIENNEFTDNNDFVDEEKLTQWFMSAIKGDVSFLKSNYESCVGKRGEGRRTALMYAAEQGNLSCVKFLSHFDDEISQQDEDGNTAMMYAAKGGFLDCIEVLVEDENNIINKENKRAVDIAKEKDFVECIGYLSLYEYETGEEDEDSSTNSSTNQNTDSNDERNLIKENKKLRNKSNVLKKAQRDVDKHISKEKIMDS